MHDEAPTDPAEQQLSTARLRLRPFKDSDVVPLALIANDRRIADGTISVAHPFGPAEASAFLAADRSGRAAGTRHGYAICLQNDDRPMIGYAGLHHVDQEHGEAELSFWIGAAHEGHGYVSEAGARLIRHAFDDLGLNRICAFHMVRNPGSGRVLQRLGFQREGLLRQRVRKWGVFEDVLAWSRLQSDV